MDAAESKALASQVLDIAPADRYAYQGTLPTLGRAAVSESIQEPELPQTVEVDVDVDNETLQMVELVFAKNVTSMHSQPKMATFFTCAIGSTASVTSPISRGRLRCWKLWSNSSLTPS